MVQKSRFVAYHTDIARGAYMRTDAFKQMLGLASDAGFTHVVPYLENMIALPSISKACPQCAYSPETWQDFEACARSVGLDLVPHFNVIGHSAQICKAYPELAGQLGSCELDVTTDVVREWTCKALLEFCAISTSDWFLIGGDEWQTPSHLLQNPGFNVAHAWAGQINLAVETLVGENRTPIVWHDMLMHYPEALGLLSRNAVIAFWFYDVDSNYAAIQVLQDHGFRVIMASGTCDGSMSERRVNAATQAIAAAAASRAAGFMMTSWEHQRFEEQKLIIDSIGKLMRGERPAQAILQAESIHEAFNSIHQTISVLRPMLTEMEACLDDPAWVAYPLARACRKAWLHQDVEADLDSFTRYQYPEGPFHGFIRQGANCAPRYHVDGLTLESEQAEPEGICLTIRNGEERLRLYPRYGPTLQDWAIGEVAIIPHALPRFLSGSRPTGGGYRSFNGVGGLRPIWALGTHHNPCILWQYKWDWEVEEETAEVIRIRLTQSFYHVDMTCVIIVEAGQPGFRLELSGINKLDHARIGFNWNLPLQTTPEDLPHQRFTWETPQGQAEQSMFDPFDGAFMLPAQGALTFETSRYRVLMEPHSDAVHGYFVDWSPSFVTPDLRSTYQQLARGESLSACWSFSATRRTLTPDG